MFEVYRAKDLTEAHLLRGLLMNVGIAAMVMREHLHAVRGGVQIDTGTCPGVAVLNRADLGRAMRMVADYASREELTPPLTWICPKCDEALSTRFTDCWNCGTGSQYEPYR